jgi:O-antigen/teichoic acid export membrane protein
MSWVRLGLQSIRSRLAGRTKVQAALYYASSSLVCQSMRFSGIILSTRLIDAEQFGYFAQASLALLLGGLIREIGQSNALLSYNGQDRRYAVFNFQLNAGFGLMSAGVLWGALAWVPAIPDHLRVVAPILVVAGMADILTQTGLITAQKEFRFASLARIEIGAVGAWLLALVIGLFRVEGYIALLLAQLAESTTRAIAVMILSGWRYVGWASGADLRGYYFGKFARHMVPQNFLQTIAGRLDYVLLASLSTVAQLGVYERMLQFIRIPWSLSINLMDKVLLVSYSREQADAPALRNTLRKSTQMIALGVTGAVCVATAVLLVALRLLVGPDWAETIIYHWWIALVFTVLTPFVWNLRFFLQATGHTRQYLINTVVLLVVSLVMGLTLVGRFGAAGMLAAQGVTHVFLLAYQIHVVRRTLFEIEMRAAPVTWAPNPGVAGKP